MHTRCIIWLALSAITISSAEEDSRLWSWNQNTEPTQPTKERYQIENGDAGNDAGNGDANIQPDADFLSVDAVIDTILATNRQGRNLDGFDEVYSDPTVQDALQKGDDTQARNLIKEKLCSLGLMQCDGEQNVEGKRPFLPPGELIYAHPPNAPYRGPPLRPPPGTKIMYGPPRPMPPGIVNKFGPPRKVGYVPNGIGPVHNGPSFVNAPPPHFHGPVYHSKPPGQIFDPNSPYKFDSNKETILTNEEYQALHLGGSLGETSIPQKPVHNDGITGGGSNSVNIHHHYHHVDGAANTKTPTVVVNNPIPVPLISNGNGLINSEFSSVNHHQAASSGFNPLTSGFNNLNTGQNAEIYGSGAKPIYENANNYDTGAQFGSSSFGATGAGGFGQQSQGTNSYHSSNPDYYKKALKGNSGINSLNSYNPQFGGGYGGLYSNGQNFQGQESARQDNFDCLCVPYDQCPARDVLGRKGDLILPLDPRNLGSDIEALIDATNTSSVNSTRTREETLNASSMADDVKSISKREIDVKKSDEPARVDGEAVSTSTSVLACMNEFGLGLYRRSPHIDIHISLISLFIYRKFHGIHSVFPVWLNVEYSL